MGDGPQWWEFWRWGEAEAATVPMKEVRSTSGLRSLHDDLPEIRARLAVAEQHIAAARASTDDDIARVRGIALTPDDQLPTAQGGRVSGRIDVPYRAGHGPQAAPAAQATYPELPRDVVERLQRAIEYRGLATDRGGADGVVDGLFGYRTNQHVQDLRQVLIDSGVPEDRLQPSDAGFYDVFTHELEQYNQNNPAEAPLIAGRDGATRG